VVRDQRHALVEPGHATVVLAVARIRLAGPRPELAQQSGFDGFRVRAQFALRVREQFALHFFEAGLQIFVHLNPPPSPPSSGLSAQPFS
jgi:hypothetical protein